MTATNHLQPMQFYHGTAAKLSPGDTLTPQGANAYGRTEKASSHEHVYFSDQKQDASDYAWYRSNGSNRPGEGRMYQVQPQGDYESDKFGKQDVPHEYRTTAPVRVIAQVGSIPATMREPV